MKEYGYIADTYEVGMLLSDARACSHPGACDDDVVRTLRRPYIKRQLAAIPDQALIRHLWEYGAWEEDELQDRATNEARTIWILAGDILGSVYHHAQD